MLFNYNNTKSEINIFNIDLPKDVEVYNVLLPDSSTFSDSYYLNENVFVNCTDINTGASWCSTGFTEIILTEDIFRTGNTVYVQNLYLLDPSGNTIDFSGAYKILNKVGINITIDLQVYGYKLLGQPRVSFYQGVQVSILRVNGENNTTFNERYDVSYKII